MGPDLRVFLGACSNPASQVLPPGGPITHCMAGTLIIVSAMAPLLAFGSLLKGWSFSRILPWRWQQGLAALTSGAVAGET